ncbi:MAG: hypothetical protein M5U01_17585 [Ardenticatenaceae bacterium]|nr:hypothetical protein [Ardenticatenaceae bacterium]HBY93939.1 DUF3303 domain-containing protein [Chloroflexota bacterium]
MLWYCAFTWFPGTTRAEVAERVLQQHEAGTNHPDRIRGWYNLVGGGAGFMLVETENADELTEMLQPYMDLMSWDIRALHELQYDSEIKRLREVVKQGA